MLAGCIRMGNRSNRPLFRVVISRIPDEVFLLVNRIGIFYDYIIVVAQPGARLRNKCVELPNIFEPQLFCAIERRTEGNYLIVFVNGV